MYRIDFDIWHANFLIPSYNDMTGKEKGWLIWIISNRISNIPEYWIALFRNLDKANFAKNISVDTIALIDI